MMWVCRVVRLMSVSFLTPSPWLGIWSRRAACSRCWLRIGGCCSRPRCDEGRPSVPADIAASVMVLQALHGLSDREAMAAVRTDLRFKVACGRRSGMPGSTRRS